MAANRAGPRRPTAPTSLTPQPKAIISMEEWEAKAPLGELETRSIGAIKASSERVPLPLKFSADEAGPSRPSTPISIQRNRPIPGSPRPPTPLSTSASTRSTAVTSHALHPKQPVQTPQQFYDWFALIDRSVAHSQEAHFRAHVANVSEHLDTCDQLVAKIDLIDEEVDHMMEGWRGVEEGGKSLKGACEKLLEERDKLLELTDEIGARLEYFQELEHATRMLNHPGESLVLQTDFLYMVERVDICIDYLKAHRNFREAEIYLFRYQQCMTRAMTLIKMYFVGSLRALSVDVSKRIPIRPQDVSPTAQMHLLYTRFKTVSQQLLPLLNELERRARAHPQELSALLSECHAAYFAARKSLLVSRITEEIKGLDPARTELVELTRAGCSYLKQLCTDEFELFREFFSSGENQLYQYLENLCDYLYDDLRPRILHEPRLTALCEVCTVLQALMVLDVSAPSDSDSEDFEREEDELSLDLDHPRHKHTLGLGRLHISHLLQMVLQDAQTRLFFKAQAVIQSDIRYYVPRPEDLAYPDILVDARKPTTGMEIREKESVSQIFRVPSLDKQDTWYPTLRKTVWVLSQLHDFVKPAIYEDIAQEAISLCRQSLVSAAEIMRQTKPFDAQLFLARHLLLLRDITQNLDLIGGREDGGASGSVGDSVDAGVSVGGSGLGSAGVGMGGGGGDYVGVTDTLASMLSRTTSLLPDALFASLGMPRADESIKGAKHGIDHELRRACEDIIAQCADPIIQPLQEWSKRADPSLSSSSPSPFQEKGVVSPPPASNTTTTVTTAKGASPSPADVSQKVQRLIETDLRANVVRMRLYLEDDRTARVLLEHVRERVGDAYAVFWGVGAGRMLGGGEGEVLSLERVRSMLVEVCAAG
ncbi:Conserved oligomeric Golgi complex subunit 3 [Hypsizygus marmoreus]|uniref:Conserved oligomeric Golgi complex subunit 3 n=1 Tax=Hypsizygus marmoreus TaxID=39966 RepID=A0A369J6R1_HYPMA|nr:Conserved oligomeric Golgi complex subunit 3 [Hypsizygus marmoreus]